MPIYEYECKGCGHQFEKLLRLNETPGECPACQSADLEKLLALPAISTGRSREKSLKVARKRAQGIKAEQDHAQREYERNYIKDHS